MSYRVKELNERLNKKSSEEDSDDDGELNEVCDNSSAAELTNFTDCRTAVMMMRVDSEAAESGSNSDFVDVVRKVAMAVIGEVIVVQETLNSVAVVLGPNVPTSTGSRVVQLVTLARQVIDTVRLEMLR